MKLCSICGQPWDECNGECQEWITLKQKAEYLKAIETYQKSHNQIAKELLKKEKEENGSH